MKVEKKIALVGDDVSFTQVVHLNPEAARRLRACANASGKPQNYLDTELDVYDDNGEGIQGLVEYWSTLTDDEAAAEVLDVAFKSGFDDRWDINDGISDLETARGRLFPYLTTEAAKSVCEEMAQAAKRLDGDTARRLSESLGPSETWAREATEADVEG